MLFHRNMTISNAGQFVPSGKTARCPLILNRYRVKKKQAKGESRIMIVNWQGEDPGIQTRAPLMTNGKR